MNVADFPFNSYLCRESLLRKQIMETIAETRHAVKTDRRGWILPPLLRQLLQVNNSTAGKLRGPNDTLVTSSRPLRYS